MSPAHQHMRVLAGNALREDAVVFDQPEFVFGVARPRAAVKARMAASVVA
jgi:hypothetical protein